MDAVPGSTGAILADWEGEAVEQVSHFDVFDIKVIGAHKGILLNLMKDAHRKMDAGEMRHTIITTENQHYLTAAIGDNYVLVMTLDKTALLGLASYNFQETAKKMYGEIY